MGITVDYPYESDGLQMVATYKMRGGAGKDALGLASFESTGGITQIHGYDLDSKEHGLLVNGAFRVPFERKPDWEEVDETPDYKSSLYR